MQKLIISLFILVSTNLVGQEHRDYQSFIEQNRKARNLYQAKNYAAAYELFGQLIKDSDEFPQESSTIIRAKLHHALSANFAGKSNGIALIQQFIKDYPYHSTSDVAHLELAKHYLNQRNLSEALDNLNQVNRMGLNEEQVDDYNMSLGYIFYEDKNFQQAEAAFAPVAKSNSPNRIEATYFTALSQYENGKYEQAWDNFTTIEALPKYQEQASIYKASMLFEDEKYDEVATYVEENPNLSRNNPSVSQIIGQSYFNLERFDDALPYLEQHTQGRTQSAEAQYQLAYTYYQVGDYKKAVKAFEQLNIIENEVGQYALFALADSHLKLKDKEKAKNAFARASKLNFNEQITEDARFNEAKLSYQLNRNDEAITLVNAFIQDYPNSVNRAEANEILIDLLLTTNNYKDAYDLLITMPNRTDRMDEALQKVAYFRAVELYNNNQLAAAKPLFDKVIEYPKDLRYVALSKFWLSEMAYQYNRYPLSINYANEFLQTNVNKPSEYISRSNYTKGYSNYRLKNYQEAIREFNQVNANSDFKNDAILRTADSYFALKQYQNAQQNYAKARQPDDYANFQIAMLKGLQGQRNQKKRQLRDIFTNRENSAYADDALYEYARMRVNEGDFSTAESELNQLIRTYPNSEKVSSAYNQLGFIDYNQSKYEEALIDYKKILEDYPQTEDAGTAMTAIRQIYIDMGRPDDYFAYLNEKNIDINTSEQELIVYQAAETQYENGDCEAAIRGMSNYISQYPKGIYLANAYFYRGECKTNLEEAVADFRAVLDLPQTKFTERSLLRVARFALQNKQANEAIQRFEALQELNKNSESIYNEEIEIGLMRAHHLNKNIPTAATYAKRVIEQENLELLIEHEARIILGNNEWATGNIAKAQEEFAILAEIARNEYGAEARYNLSKILFDQEKYNESIEACYRVPDETPSQDDFVAKSFILIADNYSALGELFQAKATLESVIENYTGSDQSIVTEATQKRDAIVAQEKEENNLEEGELE